MTVVRSLDDLASAAGAPAARGRSLTVGDEDVDGELTLDFVSAERITFDHTSLDGPLCIRSCHVEELLISHVAAEGIVITNSRIGRLTLRRPAAGCDVTVSDSTVIDIELHSCGSVLLERLTVPQSVHASTLGGSVSVTDSRLNSMALRSQVSAGRLGRPRVEIRRSHVADDLVLDDLWLDGLVLSEVDVRDLTLRRVRLDAPLAARDIRCRDGARINGLVIPDTPSTVSESTIQGRTEVREISTIPRTPRSPGAARLDFLDSTLGRLSAGSRGQAVIGLHRTEVLDGLGLPSGRTRYQLDGESSVADIDLGGRTFRNREQVRRYLGEVFISAGTSSFELLRVSLANRGRHNEEDQLYYLARQQEARALPASRRWFAVGVLGGVLGWGVRAGKPLRVLLLGVLCTALGLDLSGALAAHGHAAPVRTAGRALAMAAALWLNVGTGTPSQLSSPRWTALAVVFAATGLVLTTLVVGIVIRKLVR